MTLAFQNQWWSLYQIWMIWISDHKDQQKKFDGSGITTFLLSWIWSFLAIFHNTEPRDTVFAELVETEEAVDEALFESEKFLQSSLVCEDAGEDAGDPQFEIFTTQKWGHPTFFEIDSWNFQQMLDLGFCETSQNFSSFRQLFFLSFQGGTKGKNSKTSFSNFSAFSLGNYEKKVV